MNLPALETNAVTHCTNRCAACSHFAPVLPPSYLDPADLERDLKVLAKVLHVGLFKVLGGEPLLHPKLTQLLQVARASGIADQVGILTNGSRLEQAPEILWSALDFVQVQVYPGKLTRAQQAWMRDAGKHYGVSVELRPLGRFYKTLRREPRPVVETFSYFKECYNAHNCTAVERGYLYRCPQSIFIPPVVCKASNHAEGLKLDARLTETGVRDFLESEMPRQSCQWCSRDDEYFEWHETTKAKWLEESSV